MKKNQLVMYQNLIGTDQKAYNLQGSGVKFTRIPKIAKTAKRNIYA